MKIPTLPFTVTDWAAIAPTRHPGEQGFALWRTLEIGDIRVRMVEYSPGYLADHWCDRGTSSSSSRASWSANCGTAGARSSRPA